MNKSFKLKYIYFNRAAHWLYDIFNKTGRSLYYNSIPIHNNEGYNPFFIVGSGRSGNTLLRRILNAKSGIVIPPETYVLGKIFRLYHVHKNMEWDDHVNLILSTYEYHPEFYTFELNTLIPLALSLKEAESAKRSLAYIVNEFYKFYAQEKHLNMQRWGDKTPTNAIYVYRLKKLFPQSQFIHIVRDGVDVIHSYVNAEIYNDYYSAALRWKGSVNFLRRFGKKNPEHYCEIKYEDLVINPEKVVQKVCTFLNVAFEKKMLSADKDFDTMGDVKYKKHHKNIYNKINSDNIGKGRENLMPEVKKKIAPVLNNTLKNFGYNKILIH